MAGPGSVLVAVVVYNEGERLGRVLAQFPKQRSYDVLVVDDGSTDGSTQTARAVGLTVLAHNTNRGVGAAIRTAITYARAQGYEFMVVMAGNGKMLPAEIPRLTEPLLAGQADYVQGSRYLAGGRAPNLPLFRRVMIHLFTRLVNAVSDFRGTDVTCGFRAYRLSVLDLPGVNLEQLWLDHYEMEYYIHHHVLRARLRVVEVPISMVYPDGGKDYSKIRPFRGWWSMVRPWILLKLHLKH